MTVYSKLVKLKVDQQFAKLRKPRTTKIDYIWYQHENDLKEQYLQLVTTNQHPVAGLCGNNNTLDNELSTLPICQDAVRERKNTPKGGLHKVTTMVEHPGLQRDRDYLKSRMKNINYKWVNKEELLEINLDLKRLGYTKGIDVEQIKMHPTKPLALYKIKTGDLETGE